MFKVTGRFPIALVRREREPRGKEGPSCLVGVLSGTPGDWRAGRQGAARRGLKSDQLRWPLENGNAQQATGGLEGGREDVYRDPVQRLGIGAQVQLRGWTRVTGTAGHSTRNRGRHNGQQPLGREEDSAPCEGRLLHKDEEGKTALDLAGCALRSRRFTGWRQTAEGARASSAPASPTRGSEIKGGMRKASFCETPGGSPSSR